MTIDSGASDSVIPRELMTHIPIGESMGSKMGVTYTAANGGVMRNYGQRRVNGKTNDGKEVQVTMQVTDVNKALVSVGQICEAGNTVLFNKSGGEIISNKDGSKTKFYRENGVYRMDVHVPVPKQEERVIKNVSYVHPNQYAALVEEDEEEICVPCNKQGFTGQGCSDI